MTYLKWIFSKSQVQHVISYRLDKEQLFLLFWFCSFWSMVLFLSFPIPCSLFWFPVLLLVSLSRYGMALLMWRYTPILIITKKMPVYTGICRVVVESQIYFKLGSLYSNVLELFGNKICKCDTLFANYIAKLLTDRHRDAARPSAWVWQAHEAINQDQ